MPKRIISDVTWKSKKVRTIQPPEFRAEYAWIMPAVEDNGVFECDPESLWADAYALARPGWTPGRVKELLDELIRVGLLIRYEAQGKTWCYLVGSDKPGHLPAPSMRNSKFPLPSSYDKPSQSLGKSYDEPSLPLTSPTESFLGIGIGPGIGPGLGSGLGSGSGHGTGEGEALALATQHSMTLQKNTKQKHTERESVEKDDNDKSISLAEYLYFCMDKLNPDAILNAPAKWKQYWAGDIGKLLSTYTASQVSEIIKESQLNPTFRKYVVRGKGLADMAESIWTHLVEHGGYPNEPGESDEDVEESDDSDSEADEEDEATPGSDDDEQDDEEEARCLDDLVTVWKLNSGKHVSILDFRDILRDEKLPIRDPINYVAKVIRWTLQSWPERGKLKSGSQTFARRFREIQEAFAISMSGPESSSPPVDPLEEEF